MCQHTRATHAVLQPAMTAASAARRLVRQRACRTHGEHLLAAVELVVTELVTNAVRHGRPPVRLELDCVFGSGLHLAVSDASPAPPRPRSAALDAGGGRGMFLVAALSTAWGVAPAGGGGKRVWVVLDTERPALA